MHDIPLEALETKLSFSPRIMSRFVRPSSYRHVYGQPAKKEKVYDNIKVSAIWHQNAEQTRLTASPTVDLSRALLTDLW